MRELPAPLSAGKGGVTSRRLGQWFAAAGVGSALLLQAGCVATGPLEYIRNGFKVGPNYCKPPAPVADEWIEAKNPSVLDTHQHDWWKLFNDPGLNSLIDTAYAQNLNLRIIGTRVLEARAQQAIAVGNFFPQSQQATGEYSRVAISQNMANNPTIFNQFLANQPGASSIPASEIPTNFYSAWTAGFNLSWELDFWGRYRRAIESNNANFDASTENFDNALVSLLGDVAANYVQYRVAQVRIQIARDNVKIQKNALALAEQRFKVGTATRLDVDQARTVLEQTRSSIPALQITLGQANDLLCTLLGIPPRDLEEQLGPGVAPGADPLVNVPASVAVGIPADLLRRRPDIRSAERQVAAQSAQIGVAEADLYPTIFINGTLGYEAQDLSKLFESQSFMGNITPNFKWNILNYGRIVNNVHLQQVKTQELIATYQNQVLTAAQQVQTALRGYLRSREQAEDLGRSVKAAVSATETGLNQYKAGTIPFNTIFNLETTQVQQQDNLAVAQGNIALNLINVYRFLGGGWEIRLERDKHGPGPALASSTPETPGPSLPAPRPAPVAPAESK